MNSESIVGESQLSCLLYGNWTDLDSEPKTDYRIYVYDSFGEMEGYHTNSTDLKNATLQFPTDRWKNATTLEMEMVNNRTCRAVILGQVAGIFVNYMVEASAVLENVLATYGNYSVKYASALNLTMIGDAVYLGENITVRGRLTPTDERLPITVYFTSAKQIYNLLYACEWHLHGKL